MNIFQKTILAFILLLPLFSIAQSEEDLIKWSAGKKLQWKDYLSEPDKNSDAAASTSTRIGFEYHIRDNNLTYTLSCNFSKTRSWGRHKNDYILSHEQGHFDIAEIFTRKLAKALSEYKFKSSSYKNDLKKIYTDVMQEKEKFQQQYDNETDYSRNDEKQATWLKKIKEALSDLKEFADY
jgi:hypothetical protein